MANTFHVSMYVKDLDAALDRYRRILGIEPAKVRPGYAKFEIADPPVIFSLVVGGEPGKISHLGIRYPGTGDVASEMARTKREGVDLVEPQPEDELGGLVEQVGLNAPLKSGPEEILGENFVMLVLGTTPRSPEVIERMRAVLDKSVSPVPPKQ